MSTPMCCEERARKAYMVALVMALKNGDVFSADKKLIVESAVKCVGYSVSEDLKPNLISEWSVDNENLPENSIAMIFLEGIIFPYKVFDIENKIKIIEQNPKIIGTVLLVNSPGGYEVRCDILQDVIKKSMKPIAVNVTSQCCSAAMEIVCGAKRIFCNSKQDVLGSVGTMTTFLSFKKYFEKEGIVWEDIYATLSTRKNEESRQLEENIENDEKMKAFLDVYNENFHRIIADAYGLNRSDDLFTGRLVFAEEAITKGIAHEIAPIESVIKWTFIEGLKNKE